MFTQTTPESVKKKKKKGQRIQNIKREQNKKMQNRHTEVGGE